MPSPRLTALLVAALVPGWSTTPSLALTPRTDPNHGRHFEQSHAVLRGRVVSQHTSVDERGRIQTHFRLQVLETLKGQLPAQVTITLPGGVVGNRGESAGCQPQLSRGEERLFFLVQNARGALVPHGGCQGALSAASTTFPQALADARCQSLASWDPGVMVTQNAEEPRADGEGLTPLAVTSGATNVLTGGTGIGYRFLQPDRGEPIPYLVDADTLPSGLSTNNALTAVSNALAAWEAVSSARFSFQGLQSFGQPASSVSADDGVLRIQLHDLWGAIEYENTLGIGGASFWTSVEGDDWTTGGEVFGNDFHEASSGYVVLNHTAPSMQVWSTFTEVLCHEIGHALGMAHSSEDPNQPAGSPAQQAQMYYLAHEDGRGAAPTSWDTNVLQQIHPNANTPPYLFDRVMDIVTASPQPSVPGVNEIQVKGYDRQSTTLSVAFAETNAANGTFSSSAGLLRFTANGAFNGSRFDPAGNGCYDYLYARCSDGVHASPFVWLRVVSFSKDQYPSISDGIPDNWMIANFGNANPAVGTSHGATQDKDGDGISNRDEYRSWMSPTNAASAQRLSAAPEGTVSWQGQAYELYELQGSTNLTDWFFVQAVLPTTDTPKVKVKPPTSGPIVYRAVKVP